MIPDNERCRAMLKYIWHWRCGRRAHPSPNSLGLCSQHRHFGATVPSEWRAENDPVAPFMTTPARKEEV